MVLVTAVHDHWLHAHWRYKLFSASCTDLLFASYRHFWEKENLEQRLRFLFERARYDHDAPLPEVFSLSSLEGEIDEQCTGVDSKYWSTLCSIVYNSIEPSSSTVQYSTVNPYKSSLTRTILSSHIIIILTDGHNPNRSMFMRSLLTECTKRSIQSIFLTKPVCLTDLTCRPTCTS